MKEFISTCIFALAGLFLTGQNLPSQIPGLKHFGPEHGLPSSECHDLLHDNNGLLWIATDNGICSFDGRQFRNYGTNQGLSDPVVLHIAQNAAGEILCLSLNYKLSVFKRGRFVPHPREFILRNKVVPGDIPQGLIINENGNILIATSRSGILCIDCPDEKNYNGGKAMLELYISQAEAIAGGNNYDPEAVSGNSVSLMPQGQQLTIPESLSGKLPLRAIARDNRYLFSAGSTLIDISGNTRTSVYRPVPGKIQALHQESNGRLWIGSSEGLYVLAELGNPEETRGLNRISGISVSCLLPAPDQESLWIASADQGLFFMPNPASIVFEEPGTAFTSMESDAEGNLYLLDDDGNLRVWNTSEISSRPLLVATGIQAICASEDNGVIAIGIQSATTSTSLRIISNDILRTSGVLGAKLHPATGEVLINCRQGFHVLNADNGELLYSSSQHQFYERCYDLQRDGKRRLWAATASGLYIKNQEGFNETTPLHDNTGQGIISDMAMLPDGKILFLEKGKGLILENGERLSDVIAYHGISASTYRKIRIAEDGSILLTGPSGAAHCILKGDRLEVVAFADASDGLARGEICDALVTNGKLAVLSRHGITLLPKIPAINEAKMPISLSLLEGDSLASVFEESGLSGPFRFISAEFFRPQSLRYRFRLNPESPWIESSSPEITFPDLPGGEYQLEVSASIFPERWSQSTIFPFRVNLPYWKTWWFYMVCSGALIVCAYLLLRYTLKKLRKSDIIEKKLIHLERSALLAQMNPHFIFNSLNSIQSYIALNENDKANRFLAKFARLIRAMLNHSRAQKIALHEEIESLKLYLELEKMRFKDKFEYEITVDKDIDTAEVELPPLLIQPYLENAIIHGLARKEGVGRVELLYLKIGQYLIATVTDNGIGLEAARKMKDKPDSLHKSVGMTITQKRLELLDEGSTDKKVTIEEVKDRFGKVLGTKVEVKIKL
jgi:hypothetical protein